MPIGIPDIQKDLSAFPARAERASRRAYRHDRGLAKSSAVLKHGIVNTKPRKGLVIPNNTGIYPLSSTPCEASGQLESSPAKDRRMSTQVVLITGELTGIGRATAVAFAKKGAKVALPVGVIRPARRSLTCCALSVRRPSSSTPTSARRMTSALWSTRPSHSLAVSMSR